MKRLLGVKKTINSIDLHQFIINPFTKKVHLITFINDENIKIKSYRYEELEFNIDINEEFNLIKDGDTLKIDYVNQLTNERLPDSTLTEEMEEKIMQSIDKIIMRNRSNKRNLKTISQIIVFPYIHKMEIFNDRRKMTDIYNIRNYVLKILNPNYQLITDIKNKKFYID